MLARVIGGNADVSKPNPDVGAAFFALKSVLRGKGVFNSPVLLRKRARQLRRANPGTPITTMAHKHSPLVVSVTAHPAAVAASGRLTRTAFGPTNSFPRTFDVQTCQREVESFSQSCPPKSVSRYNSVATSFSITHLKDCA